MTKKKSQTIDILELSEKSSSDDLRIQMQWNDEHDQFITEIRNEALYKSTHHAVKHSKFKKIYYGLAIPNVIIPLAVSSLNPLFINLQIVNIIGGSFATIIAGVFGFANIGRSVERHKEFIERYEALVIEIDLILVTSKRFRNPADVTLEKLKNKLENLNSLAPN